MPNKNYVNGRSFEYRCKKYLESKGCFVVRTAGSHSPVDLIAFKEACIAIQCKNSKKSLSMAERTEITQTIRDTFKGYIAPIYVAVVEPKTYKPIINSLIEMSEMLK